MYSMVYPSPMLRKFEMYGYTLQSAAGLQKVSVFLQHSFLGSPKFCTKYWLPNRGVRRTWRSQQSWTCRRNTRHAACKHGMKAVSCFSAEGWMQTQIGMGRLCSSDRGYPGHKGQHLSKHGDFSPGRDSQNIRQTSQD